MCVCGGGEWPRVFDCVGCECIFEYAHSTVCLISSLGAQIWDLFFFLSFKILKFYLQKKSTKSILITIKSNQSTNYIKCSLLYKTIIKY